MSTPWGVQEILERNKAAAATFKPQTFGLSKGETKPGPMKVIITCTDPRVIPVDFLGLKLGEGLLLRANGGRVESVFTDMLAFDYYFGVTDILVIHHTDCGFSHMKQPLIQADLKAKFPEVDPTYIDSLQFRTFHDLEQSVRDDLKFIRESPIVRQELKERTTGYVFNIENGILTPVM